MAVVILVVADLALQTADLAVVAALHQEDLEELAVVAAPHQEDLEDLAGVALHREDLALHREDLAVAALTVPLALVYNFHTRCRLLRLLELSNTILGLALLLHSKALLLM